MKNKKSILILIFSILIFLITVGTFVLFIRIIDNKNIHTSAVLSNLEIKMIDKENLSVLKDKVKEIEIIHNKIKDYFLYKDKADLFVEFLENIGVNPSTKIIVKGVEPSLVNPNIIKFTVSIEDKNLENIMNTISILENIPYNIFIESTYINKEVVESESKTKDSKIINNTFTWNADVTFGILSME